MVSGGRNGEQRPRAGSRAESRTGNEERIRTEGRRTDTSEPDDDDGGGGGGEHVPLLISSSSLGLSLGEEAAKNSPGTNRDGSMAYKTLLRWRILELRGEIQILGGARPCLCSYNGGL